jgi:hypothetical protein
MDVKAANGSISDGSSNKQRGIPARALIPTDAGRDLTNAESNSCIAPALMVPDATIRAT